MLRFLVKLMRVPWMRTTLFWLFGRLILRMSKDDATLTGRFFARGAFETQNKIFTHVQKQYPADSHFIALSLDFDFLGYGTPILPYEKQLEELAELCDKQPESLIPFCSVDPRRPDALNALERWHNQYKIKGVKIYPNMGYFPDHPVLLDVYKYCEKNKLPILAHCSPGGIQQFGSSKEEARKYGNPENYRKLLEDFPRLNFCLAHFGGAEEWEKHLTGETPREGMDATWLTLITNMLREKKENSSLKKYPNLFTDVSYTLFKEMPSYRPFNYINFLTVLLEEKDIRDQVLFGTDYYMVEREKVSEKEVSIALRAFLGEKFYFQIAHYNPIKYLYLANEESRVG